MSDDFDKLFAEAVEQMQKYIDRQTTERTKSDAEHRLKMMRINRGYYSGQWARGKAFMCHGCGQIDTPNYTAPTGEEMQVQQICFRCNHWEQIANKQDPRNLIIDGCIYGDGGNYPNTRSQYLGFGGHRWYIKRDGRVWTTNNLWSGGTIPEEFRERLPNNAEFLTKEEFEKEIQK